MQLFNDISLRKKLISIILGTSLVALISGFMFVLLFRIASYKTNFIDNVEIHADLIKRSCVTSLQTRDREETAKILAQLQAVPYIKDVIVYDANQEVIATYRALGEDFNPPFPVGETLSTFTNGDLHIIQTMQHEGDSLGKLYLRASTHELDRRIIFFGITLSALLIVLLVIVYFLARAAQSMVSKPILGLMNATKKVSGSYGSGPRGRKKTKDEIKILRERFDYILENAPLAGGIPMPAEIKVTDQGEKGSEETQIDQEGVYRELFENMSLGVMVLESVDDGKDFLIKDFNKGGERMEHVHRADAIGKNVTKMFPGVKTHGLLEAFKKTAETGYEMHNPFSQYREGEKEGWRESHIYRLDSGEIVVVFSDVSARKLAKEAREKIPEKATVPLGDKREIPSKKELEDAFGLDKAVQLEGIKRELEALFYAVANDLGVPLEGMDEFSKSLLEEYAANLDNKGKNYLIQIRAASHRLKQLFNDISQLSQLSLDTLRLEKVDLSSLARQKALELKEGNPDRKVEFAIQEGVNAHGDARMLGVVINHLFTNAWLYTAKRPLTKIEFGCLQEKSGPMEFYVKDNGTGFDMANSDKIFVPFQRLHADEVYPGTGMGLAVTRRIIHRHGGIMHVEAEPEKGAVFYFTLIPNG
jgi:signal transduction histidine kinase